MKNEKLIIELTNINQDYNDLRITEIITRLEKDLKESIALKSTPKTKINAIKRVLNAKTNEYRPALKHYDIQDNKMVFTDSYQAYRIDNLENNPFEKTNPEKETYPNLGNCIPKQYDENKTITFDYAEAKALSKTFKELKKGIVISDSYMLDPHFVVNALEIMPSDTIYYLVDDRIVYGLSEATGDDCLLLPCKIY